MLKLLLLQVQDNEAMFLITQLDTKQVKSFSSKAFLNRPGFKHTFRLEEERMNVVF